MYRERERDLDISLSLYTYVCIYIYIIFSIHEFAISRTRGHKSDYVNTVRECTISSRHRMPYPDHHYLSWLNVNNMTYVTRHIMHVLTRRCISCM